MKRKMILTALVLVCMMVLTGCFCQHEVWNEANCTTPKTCAECGETEGAPLGHSWISATCETPKTCEVCALTEGEAKGHSWVEATCETAKVCSDCHLTEGEALGHSWVEATTEAPKTCEVCALTEGERIVTDPRFTTADTIHLHGIWSSEFTLTGHQIGLTGYADPFATVHFQIEFTNDGNLIVEANIIDVADLRENLVVLYTKEIYTQLAAEGMDKDDVDNFLKNQYGVNMDTYIRSIVTEEFVDQLVEQFRADTNTQGVYYISNGILYAGDSWSATMTEEPYTLNDNLLVLANVNAAFNDRGAGTDITFTRSGG